MTAILPALLVALSAAWTGTFLGGATWSGAFAGDVSLIALALVAVTNLRDPLRLGRGPALLLMALLLVIAASALTSPVPRAGLEPLALLPAFLLVPAATERLWRNADRRRLGAGSLAVAGALIAIWALVVAAASGTLRAAAPLGHHGALASCLVFLLPFAVRSARERGAWRITGTTAAVSIAACIVVTRSFVGLAMLVVQTAFLIPARRSRWLTVGALALVAVIGSWPRLMAIAAGADPSMAARVAYFEAGARGVLARPALGWGPGSVGWTIGEHLHAAPGRNPAGEVISYLHFLPLDLAYQLGLAGALLAIAVVVSFFVARRGERAQADDPALLDTAKAALVPGLLGVCFAGFQPLPATMTIALVAAGAALAATPARRPTLSDRSRRAGRAVVLLYGACALGVLAPVRMAQRLYDEARSTSGPFDLLDRAVERDAAFPLYVARRAWAIPSEARPPETSPGSTGDADARAADEALRAAERAPGTAALWLAAGTLGADAGASWSASALRRACDLDPVGALAPFRLMTIEPDEGAAAVAGARAMLAEPRLGAAIHWETHEALYRRALDELERWPGVDETWRRRAVAQLDSLLLIRGDTSRAFVLELDGDASTSFSLFVFRRLPWPTSLASIDLDGDRLEAIRVGPAANRADTEPWAFPKNGCGGADAA